MMDLVWTEQLSVGNAILDSDHKKLFGLARDIDCVTKARDHSAVSRALNRLYACVSHHFLNEELFACALGIPFAKHQQNHQNILAEIDLSRREMGKDSVVSIYIMEHYAHFLRDWLIKHITEEDMQMKQALQIRPYDFKVEGAEACGCC